LQLLDQQAALLVAEVLDGAHLLVRARPAHLAADHRHGQPRALLGGLQLAEQGVRQRGVHASGHQVADPAEPPHQPAALHTIPLPMKAATADSTPLAGRVSSQARTILTAAYQRTRPPPRTTPAPTSAPAMACVMLTGMPTAEQPSTALPADSSAATPCSGRKAMISRLSVRPAFGSPYMAPSPNSTATRIVYRGGASEKPSAIMKMASIFCPSLAAYATVWSRNPTRCHLRSPPVLENRTSSVVTAHATRPPTIGAARPKPS